MAEPVDTAIRVLAHRGPTWRAPLVIDVLRSLPIMRQVRAAPGSLVLAACMSTPSLRAIPAGDTGPQLGMLPEAGTVDNRNTSNAGTVAFICMPRTMHYCAAWALILLPISGMTADVAALTADGQGVVPAAHMPCDACTVWLYMTSFAAHIRRRGVCKLTMLHRCDTSFAEPGARAEAAASQVKQQRHRLV